MIPLTSPASPAPRWPAVSPTAGTVCFGTPRRRGGSPPGGPLARSRRHWLLRPFALATFALCALGAGAALWLRPAPLLRVQLPAPDQTVGHGGVEVLVQFPASGRAEPPTFRALLNGADVTAELERAENGVHGHLHGLLDGENVLRLEVFGRAPLASGTLIEGSRELRVYFRRPVTSDRA